MDIVVSYDDDVGYWFKRRPSKKYNRCHINCNRVREQSSPKPNNESKFIVVRRTSASGDNSKIKNNYQYFSDSELCKMPLDSSMKNSNSVSSLQPSNRGCLEQSSQVTTSSTTAGLPNRAYNSLTHNLRRRNQEQKHWRNSWGHEDQKDEFSESFELNYQYLMNNNLIDSCKEAKNDLNTSPSQDWSYSHFKQQFREVDFWLSSIEQTFNTKEDNPTIRNIRLSHIEELKWKNYQRKNFVSQSSRLVTRYPEHKDEILDYVAQLNTKWDQLTQAVSPQRSISADCCNIDVHYELHCLSKWIRAMEEKVEPLVFSRKWSLSQLKQKAKEHEIIQRDVESHGKTVLNVIKLCEKYSQSRSSHSSDGNAFSERRLECPLKKAQRWERRWHLLYLKCMEWQFYIEKQISDLSVGNSDDTASESDDEQPASKHRRLNGCVVNLHSRLPSKNESNDGNCNDLMDTGDSVLTANAVPHESSLANDNDMIESDQCNSLAQSRAGLSLNANFGDALRKLPIEALTKMIPPEFAKFDSTDVSSPRVATFYMPHEDTESEHENKAEGIKSAADSSEDECTYKNVENASVNSGVSKGVGDNEEDKSQELRDLSKKVWQREKVQPHSIQRLVERADDLLSTPKRIASRKKTSKVRDNEQVREWLRKCHQNADCNKGSSVGDSCDGDVEYTTEEDDQYERHSSCDQTVTVIGSSRDDGIDVSPVTEILPMTEPPKVVLRNKSSAKKCRPLSTSELTKIPRRKLFSMQWVSESALHKMLTPLKDSQSALSSSTIEECTTRTLEGSVNSLRRRKLKHRRRSHLSRKGHSGSADSLSSLAYDDGARRLYRSPIRLRSHYMKCDTFSEPVMMRQRLSSVDRAIASDPANYICNSTTSGTETEEEMTSSRKCLIRKKLFTQPAFRLGPQYGVVTRRDCNVALSAISAEEQLSSFSENAWDDFQERYVSEAYSDEPIDLDKVRKLTEFGDDYRNYIDSHSDCASSYTMRSNLLLEQNTLIGGDESSAPESDSELKDVRKLLEFSGDQFCCSEKLFAKQTAKPISCFFLTESDFANLRNTCRKSVRCLRDLLHRIDRIDLDGPVSTPQLIAEIKCMLEKWENLEGKTDEMEVKCSLQRDIMELRKKLQDMLSNMTNMAFKIKDRFQLEEHLKIVQADYDSIQSMNTLVSDYNFRAHRLLKDSKYSSFSLQEDITELYRVWQDADQKVLHQLDTLKQALSVWKNFDMHMFEFKTILREEHSALGILDQVNNTKLALLDPDQIDSMRTFLANPLNVEGSFSDSGISDSGSEQDTCERERRIGLLRKFVRQLEAILAPESEALLTMMKKIDEAEEEIREMQTCRKIIKTGYLEKKGTMLITKEVYTNNFQKDAKSGKQTSPDDPGSDPGKGRSIFWRMLRAALPFHVAIVVLLCVACLLEPNCCDAINNLNLSLSPQLRYISGPPPT